MIEKGLGQIRWILRLRQMRCVAQVICAIVLVLVLTGPAAAAKKRAAPKKKPQPAQKHPTFNSDIQNEMGKYLGIRYRLGGSSTSGVDCSGFVGLVYRNIYNVNDLPHQSASLYASPALHKVSLDRLDTGDLLYFKSSSRSNRVNHVGIYLSERKFIHAAREKGVIVSSLDDPHWSARVVGANRLPGLDRRYKGAVQEQEVVVASGGQDSFLSLISSEPLSTPSSDSDTLHPQILGQSFGLELGLGSTYAGGGSGLLNLTLFQEPLLAWRATEYAPPMSADEYYSWSGERPNVTPVQGLRLGSDIRPFEWLRLSPSLTYFKYDGGIDESGLPKRSVGLDMTLGSEQDRWVVSTGFRYSSLIGSKSNSPLSPGRTYTEESEPQNAWDMSLTLMQRISNNLSVSLVGELSQRIGVVASTDPSREDKTWDEHRFSLMFSFSY